MLGPVVYILSLLTSAACAWLLLSSYRRHRERLLLWSGLCFCALAVNCLLVFVDIVMLPQVDLTGLRQASSLCAVGLLIYGFVWEADE